ncbi:hypothetical protein [Tepidibacter mesophilus]|uniref:hypothetical protein n=1 Tax=Tepidibacter mesophilus TaxID=655607 RepID=UPI000C07EB35|nr:hypothetical protein [Tepidibacter mesophilus]
MLINWICLICIVSLVTQVMMFLYFNALSDIKTNKVVKRKRRESYKDQYSKTSNYTDKIAK